MRSRGTLVRLIYASVVLAATAFGASLRAAPVAVDPIVGKWQWRTDGVATFSADGTVSNTHGFDGTWQFLQNPEAQRRYRITWEHGKNIDEVTFSDDGQSAHVRNPAARVEFDAHRALPDKIAVGPAIATPASVVSGRIAAAANALAPTADPILGEWQWVHGQKATFLADGTMSSTSGMQGVWMFLRNPETVRKYVLDWKYGTYTDHFSFDPATHVGHGVNQMGGDFDATQGSAARGDAATTGIPASYFGTH